MRRQDSDDGQLIVFQFETRPEAFSQLSSWTRAESDQVLDLYFSASGAGYGVVWTSASLNTQRSPGLCVVSSETSRAVADTLFSLYPKAAGSAQLAFVSAPSVTAWVSWSSQILSGANDCLVDISLPRKLGTLGVQAWLSVPDKQTWVQWQAWAGPLGVQLELHAIVTAPTHRFWFD